MMKPMSLRPHLQKFFFPLSLIVLCLFSASGGTLRSQDLGMDPSAWMITKEMLFTAEGEPRTPEIAVLMSKLGAKRRGGARVSKKEFLALLSRPESRMVYANALLRYASPLSMDIQTQEHKDLSKKLMTEGNEKAGVTFLKVQKKYLDLAEKRFHVYQQDIVGILAWECGLGKYTGDYRIFNVFLGQILYLDMAQHIAIMKLVEKGQPNPMDDSVIAAKERRRFSKRKMDAISSLAALLRTAKQRKFDPLAVLGSWGGAIGYVQFMPYSMKWAVDADGNGLDLKTWPDAIFSVANYLKVCGGYKMKEGGRKRAILSYNHNEEYANGVMALADTIWSRHQRGE